MYGPLTVIPLLFLSAYSETIDIDCSKSNIELPSLSASYDLTTLAGEHRAQRTRETPPTTMEDTLLFNLCEDLPLRDGVDEKDQCPLGTRACLTKVNKKSGQADRIFAVVPLASSPEANVTAAATPGLSLAFKQGKDYPHPSNSSLTPQFLSLNVLCPDSSSSEDTTPKFISYDGSHLLVEWTNKAGCALSKDGSPPSDGDDKPGKDAEESERGVGSGIGWFFLVLILAFATYFAIGAYYNYATYGASGSDLIPHRDFWREVPFMLRDVIGHLCSSVRPRQHSSSRGGYISV